MKPLSDTFTQSVAQIDSNTNAWYVLQHVAAIVRKDGYKFVTKKHSYTTGGQSTAARATANALTLTHSVDVDQTDIDFISLVKDYWAEHNGPDYVSNAQSYKLYTTFNNKWIPTLALLVCEYLRQLDTAIKKFQNEYTSKPKTNMAIQEQFFVIDDPF